MKNLKSKILKILIEFTKEAVHNKNKHLYAFPDATDKLLSLFKKTMLEKLTFRKISKTMTVEDLNWIIKKIIEEL